jgi:tetratricopeptide (TPR) repeat protein
MDLERENYKAAIVNFQQELAQNPNNWRARQRLGLAYLKVGRNDEAIAELQYVLGQEPVDITALSYAPKDVDRRLAQQPGDPLTTYYLGLAFLHNGQRREAIETFESYRNKQEPLLEAEIQKQLTLIEIYDSVQLAKQALRQEKELGPQKAKSGTVAVFYFNDISKNNAFRHLQKAMAEMIITDLSQIQSLQVLERVRVQFLLAEMQLGETGLVDENTAPKFGRLLGAEKLIVGTLESGSVVVKTSIASTMTEGVVGAFSVTAEMDKFFELQKEIVYNVLQVLEVTFTPEEEKRFSKYHTKSMKAVTYFGKGLDALDAGQWKDAGEFFNMAVKEDPDFELARHFQVASPAATAPPISSLSVMTVSKLAVDVETTVAEASFAQAASSDQGENTPGGLTSSPSEPPSAAEPSTGSVTISW